MKYLFLDDERMPQHVTWIIIGELIHGSDWQIVRSFDEACQWVKDNGFPDVISFDHDLSFSHYAEDYSDEKTGYDFAKWLVNYDMDTGLMPVNFHFTVHSKNPVGAENIRELLNNYIREKRRLE